MRGGGLEHRVSSHGCAGDDQGDVASAAEVCCAFVEDDEDCGVFGVEQRRDEVVEPPVAGCDRAVVHVVAEVGDDQRVGRELSRLEAFEGEDVGCIIREIEKRDVLLRESTGAWIALGVGGPAEVLR